MTMTRVVTLLVGLLWAVSALAADPAVRVETSVQDGYVFVSFNVTGDIPEEVRASIHSGLPTTFSYDVELRQQAQWWVDRTLGAARVSAIVKYDNLMRRYEVTLIDDGRVEEVRSTEDENQAFEWMTAFQARRLMSTRTLEPNGEYYIRVRALARARGLGWPFAGGTPVLGSVTFRLRP
jgi:hypothetical protein